MNKSRLFVTSCVSLVTTAMVFAVRGDIEPAMREVFKLTAGQMGLIWSPAFWAFTVAIFISGALVDLVGMRTLHVMSGLGYVLGVALVLLAPYPAAPVESIFATTGTTLLYAGFFIMGLCQGLVEGVINPLIATIYSDEKTKRLNRLHAWWPAGMIIGGLLAYVLTGIGASWQIKLSLIVLPAVAYVAMALSVEYPRTERVASNITTADMWKEAGKPLFLLLFVCMWGTAAVELGPDQWFPSVMSSLTGLEGILFLVYTAGLMFVIRTYFADIAHTSPIGTLFVCSILAAVGLYWLGSLQPGTSAIAAFAAATIFGIGKTYLWPTMLGVTAERFPRGGALLLGLMGGAGMLSVAVVLPVMGARIDQYGPGAALRMISVLGVILAVIFGGMYFYFKARGGYRALDISATH
jgi:MFS family permease